MRKFSKKAAVVFGAALAVCAFVMPSMASALSWGPLNTEHTLTATNLGFTAHTGIVGALGATCADVHFTVDVRSAAVITITGAAFTNCTGTDAASNCTANVAGTNFHWTATGITTSNVQIHNIDIDNFFSGPACPFNGASSRLTGTLSGGRWLGNAAHALTVATPASSGLVAHIPALSGTFPITINDASIIDRQQTITLS